MTTQADIARRIRTFQILRSYNPDQARVAAGHEHGGEWGSQIMPAIEAWLKDGRKGDPLGEFSTDAIEAFGRERGLNFPKGMPRPAMTSAILAAAGGKVQGDKLGLAGRIQLGDDESLIGSDFIASDSGDLLAAWIDGPHGRNLRLGLGIAEEDRRNWRGANLGATVDLDEAGRRRLGSVVDEMRTTAAEEVAAAKAALKRVDAVEDRRATILGKQFGLDKTQSRELAKANEQLGYLAERLTRMRDEQADRLTRLNAEKDPDEIRFLEGMVRTRDGQIRAVESERARLADRIAAMTSNPAPLSPADEQALAQLDRDTAEAYAEFWRHAGDTVLQGSLRTPWGDLRYDVSISDDDPHPTYTFRPPADDTNGVQLDAAGLAKLRKLLEPQ